jgi:chromate transporter
VTAETPVAPARVSLGQLFLIFLRIGCTTWGGFMIFIAVVSKSLTARKLATEEDITDAILVAQVLPGPVAVDMTVAIGYRLRGLPGAAVCWLGSVMPSFIVVTTLSVLYMQYGKIHGIQSIFMAFPAAMVAIVAVAAYDMGRKQVKSAQQAMIGGLACAAILLQGAFFKSAWWVTFAVVICAGIAGWLLYRGSRTKTPTAKPVPVPQPTSKALALAPLGIVALFPATGAALVWKIFITFAVMSVSLFGSGYVFIPIIKSSLVNSLHWLTPQEFTAGLALTQITPGPILMTAAFVGVKIAGLPGALAGMLGMFVPPAILTLIAAHSLQAIKKSAVVTAALKGVRPAVVGMLLAAAVVVGESMPHDTAFQLLASLAILVAALFALIRLRVEVAFIIPLAGLAGFFLFR